MTDRIRLTNEIAATELAEEVLRLRGGANNLCEGSGAHESEKC